MDLYILRHGKAETIGPLYRSDYERPLSATGWKRTRRSAKGMKAMNVRLDAIVSSPLLRARQTAEIVRERLVPEAEIEISDALAHHDLGGNHGSPPGSIDERKRNAGWPRANPRPTHLDVGIRHDLRRHRSQAR